MDRPDRAHVLETGRYLARIGIDADTGPPGLDLLGALQLAHLCAVPFENLDVYHRRGVLTDVAWSYPKVVERRRGGWCFELNGSFAALLRSLGFTVDLVSCNVWLSDTWGPDFDHLALVVHLEGQRWLVDVGFGDNCLQPLLLESGEVDATPRRARLEVTDRGFTLTERTSDGFAEDEGPGPDGATASSAEVTSDLQMTWEPQMKGTFTPRQLPDFEGRSTALQTEPGQLFTAKPFATRALDGDGGRVTLRTDVLRLRDAAGLVTDVTVEASEWSDTLERHFGLTDTLDRAVTA